VIIVVLIIVALLGGRLDCREFVRQKLPVSMPAQVEIGSCYAYEYGYKVPVVMDYTPYKGSEPYRLKNGEKKPVWLAVKSHELKSLEEGSLRVTFAKNIEVEGRKPWVCLGTNSNSCYIDFNKALHPDAVFCLEPLTITPRDDGGTKLEYSIIFKDRLAEKGTVRFQVE